MYLAIRNALRWLLTKFYDVEIEGLQNFDKAGDRVLIVANHTSFLDAVLLAAFLPDKLTFAVNTFIAERWYSRIARLLVDVFPMDPMNPLSTKSLIKYVRDDHKAVIFPEGRITVTGSLMKIYQGPGLIADKSEAMVLPVRIEGAQYTVFSKLRGRVRLRWFPKITLSILPPRRLQIDENIRGRARRTRAGAILEDLMTEMMFETGRQDITLFQALTNAVRIHGGRHIIVEDIQRRPLTYRQLLMRATTLSRAFRAHTQAGDYVGLLLPNMTSTVSAFLGLHLAGRVPAMLNYTVGANGMLSACATAKIKVVYTSHRFVAGAKLEAAVEALSAVVRVVYLEDVAENITYQDKLGALIGGFFPLATYRKNVPEANASDPAVVLFTSGSEGTPKGVVLSHANLLANRQQMAARVDFSSQDTILNALPMFHSFGLTAGTILPLLSGMRTFFYPSPLHYRIVPEIAYEVNATILFGTNTFLSGYARFAHPYDFYSIRYVFAGAEKLKDDVRRAWQEKFGVRIFEGYGATETSPVLALNTPMASREGTVGRFLPGIDYRLEPVPGVEEGGRLFVKGPNVMLGYLLHARPGELVPPVTEHGAGWYDTGDIVSIADDGYITIRGRAKRFAKVGGEMVSLTAVEALATSVWPNAQHAVVAVPDAQKGEQLVLVTNQTDAARAGLLEFAKRQGIGEINVPKKILHVKQLPVLGTGKTDYVALQQLVSREYAA